MAALTAAVASSCTNARPERPSALPPLPQKVVVKMEEYRYRYDPAIVEGRTVFEVTNAGKETHRFALYRLPADMPEINAQLHGSVRRPLSDRVADVPTLKPGEHLTVAVDLAKGQRYGVICALPAPDGQSHALKGMAAEIIPVPAPEARPSPASGSTVVPSSAPKPEDSP